jgi:Papain-like cysteine protease AvrRpt2
MTNTLGPGQTLAAGHGLHAPTRPVTLVMQPDGDLVLLKSGAEKLWSSGTAGKGATHAQMKAGGNLVLIGHRATIWETKTSGSRGARLVVQDDGNLVVYGADSSVLWQSGTVTEWAAARGDRLRASEALFPGASLTAKTRPITLTLQADGNLVLAREGVPVWASDTAGKAVTSAVMQEDGNLVLHGPQGTVWASQTSGTPGAKLILQDDGNAAIVGKRGVTPWTTRTPLWPPAGRTDALWPLDALGPKDRLHSPSGQFQLVLQTDGNLVLYDGQTAIWATGTSGQTASQAAMQADGNLVLTGPGGAVVWEARTAGHPGARLVVQDDGNAVVYALDKRPLWSTGTAERRRDIGVAVQDQLYSNWCWSAVSTSVSHFYNPASAWTQCTLANAELEQTGCCADGSTPQCNKDWYLDRALKRTGNLQSWVGNAVALSDLEHEVNAGRPVGVRIGWEGGGGHFVVIDGYSDPGTGPGFLNIEDPFYGKSRMPYSAFRNTYQGTGSWTHTYYTRS